MGRLFGTDGVRGIANVELTPEMAFKLGRASGILFNKGKLFIGRDTRISGKMLESAFSAGAMSAGASVYLLGVVPTPAVAKITKKYRGDGGVVISASHNSYEFNGIKIFDRNGFKLPDSKEDELEAMMNGQFDLSSETGEYVNVENAAEEYVRFLTYSMDVNFSGLKVGLDTANGAASFIAPEVFKRLGAEVHVISQEPDGRNINRDCGSLHPESLCELVKEKHLDVGFAFDGDADRLIACDNEGSIIDGDLVLALTAQMLKNENRLKDNRVIGTVMSNMGLELFFKNQGIAFERTAVGDRYVLERMLEGGLSLGGEQSGHVIFYPENTTGDGIYTALQLLRARVLLKRPLSDCRLFRPMPQVLINVKTDDKESYKRDQSIISEIERIKALLGDKGRVLIRPSGTEPLVRVMVEGENEKEINGYAESIASMIKNR